MGRIFLTLFIMKLDLDNLEHRRLQWASKERYSSRSIPRNL